MSAPQPPVALTGSCSVIFNNTLYSYSSAAFQSLVLKEGSEWEKLPGGQPVDGGVCVGSSPKDSSQAALFVVGGTSSSSEYPGLQKFTYATGKWETLTPQVLVTKNRVYHSAMYLNGSDSILVYSGSTDGKPSLSQQTFAITTSAPYNVLAFQSSISPPGVAPLLLPWSETQAAMIGGNPTNTKVMLFDAASSWSDSGVTLAEPLPKNTTSVKAAIIQGDDGSKHLYTFDPTTSPNTVNRTVLIDANGAPMANAAPVTNNVASRDLTASNWPGYNSTLAPKAARSDYSLASDSNGLIVMSGGNEDDALTIFDGKDNSWVDTTALFGSESNQITIQSEPTGTLSTSASTVPTASPSQTVGAATSDSSDDYGVAPTTLLGVVLGVVLGVAAVLIILLMMIRHKRKKQAGTEPGQEGQPRAASSETDDKAFFQQDIQPPSNGYFQGHKQQDSAGSFSSMAILMGKAQQPAVTNDTKRNSTSSVFSKQFKSTIGRPQLQSTPDTEYLSTRDVPRDDKAVSFTADTNDPKPRSQPPTDQDGNTRRSSGWNRYWSTGSSVNILGFNGGDNDQRNTGVSGQSSFYSNKNRMTQDSATVPALQVEGRPSFSHVHSASPTVSEYNPSVPEMAGQIERPVSAVSSARYSSGIPASVHEDWDPVTSKKPWGSERAPSSAYSASAVASSAAYPTVPGPAASQPIGISKQPQLSKSSTSDMSWLILGDK